MSRFDETIQKLASAPWKHELLKEGALPHLLASPPKSVRGTFAPKRPPLSGAFAPPKGLDMSKLGPKGLTYAEILAGKKTAAWYDKAKAVGQAVGNTAKDFGSDASKYVHQAAGSDMAKEFGKGIAGTAAAGLTGYLGAKLLSDHEDHSSRTDARHKELGKLEAQQRYRQQQLKQMGPLHSAMLGQFGSDDILGKADPALMQSSYDTMRRFAPTLATDPNATRAFLQEVATYGKPPSYATLKLLADTEGSVMKTYGGHGE